MGKKETKLKYDPMLVGSEDKISEGMADYIKTEAPEYSFMLEQEDKKDKEVDGVKEEKEDEKPEESATEEDDDVWGSIEDSSDDMGFGTPLISEEEIFRPVDMLEFMKNERRNWERKAKEEGFELKSRDDIEEDIEDEEDMGSLDCNSFEGCNPVDLNMIADNQIFLALRKVEDAMDMFEEALDLIDTGAIMGSFHDAVKSSDCFKQLFASWVYDNLFSTGLSRDSIKGYLEELKYKYITLLPYISCVINDVPMVLCEVADDSLIFDEYEHEDYLKLREDRFMGNPRFVPKDWANENARFCPGCGLWVDKKISVCQCGHDFEGEHPMAEYLGDSFDIEKDIDGVTPEAIVEALGGEGSYYDEVYGHSDIHFFGGAIGCTTIVPYEGSPSGLGESDYAFIELISHGYRIYFEQIERAVSEDVDAVQETLYRFMRALYKIKGSSHVADIMNRLFSYDCSYIEKALEKVVAWLKEDNAIKLRN